jgi:hypothetical protein
LWKAKDHPKRHGQGNRATQVKETTFGTKSVTLKGEEDNTKRKKSRVD